MAQSFPRLNYIMVGLTLANVFFASDTTNGYLSVIRNHAQHNLRYSPDPAPRLPAFFWD